MRPLKFWTLFSLPVIGTVLLGRAADAAAPLRPASKPVVNRPIIRIGQPSRVLVRIGRPYLAERRQRKGKLDTILETDYILETNAAVESVRQAYDKSPDGKMDRPRPEWVRGICPQCGSDLVSNCYYVGGRGYLVVWECWASLAENPTCLYRKVI